MIIMDTNALTKQYGTQVVVNKLNMNVKKEKYMHYLDVMELVKLQLCA